MATLDVVLLTPLTKEQGSRKHKVASGAAATIKAGQLVLKTKGSPYVVAWNASNTAKPVVAADFVAGLATSDSTETATADGNVNILQITPDMVLLGNPDTAATWDTQSEYDLLVGDRVLLSTTSGRVQTILATNGDTYGLEIAPLNLTAYPGKVAFTLRAGTDYLY